MYVYLNATHYDKRAILTISVTHYGKRFPILPTPVLRKPQFKFVNYKENDKKLHLYLFQIFLKQTRVLETKVPLGIIYCF